MASFVRFLAAARQAQEDREAERRVLLEEDELQYHTPDDSEHCLQHPYQRRWFCNLCVHCLMF